MIYIFNPDYLEYLYDEIYIDSSDDELDNKEELDEHKIIYKNIKRINNEDPGEYSEEPKENQVEVSFSKYKFKNFNEFLIFKYRKRITDKIDKNKLLQIPYKVNTINSYSYPISNLSGDDYKLYIYDNKELIQIIKDLEKDNYELYKEFAFVKIQDKYKQYIYFKYDSISYTDLTLNQVILKEYYQSYSSFEDGYKSHDDINYISVIFDMNKYYQDLILSGLSIEEMKTKFINNINDIIINVSVKE